MASVSILLRAAASAGTESRAFAAQLAEQARRHDEAPPRIDRRAVLHMPHGLEFLLAAFEPASQVVERLLDVVEIEPHVLARREVVLELDLAVGPEGDFLGEPFVNGGERLIDMLDAAVGDFLEVFGHERARRRARRPSAPGRCESMGRRAGPRASGRSVGASGSRSRCGAQPANAAEPSGFTRMNCIRFESMAPSPDFTSCVSRNISHGLVRVVGRIDQHGSLPEQVGVLFEEHVGHGEHQRVAGVHQHGAGKARLVERLEGIACEGDAVVTLQDRLLLAAVAAREPAVAFADRGGNVGDLESPGFATVDRAAELVECLQEERPHEERLKAAGFGPLHLFLHRVEPIRRHRFLRQGVAVEQRLQVVVVEGVVDLLRQAGTHFGLVAVADGLHEQVLEAHAFEHFAEDVEDAALAGRRSRSAASPGDGGRRRLRGSLWRRGSRGGRPRSGRCGGCGRNAVRGGWGSRAGRS